MNKEDFAYIGCKLLAIYWAMIALNSMSTLATAWVAWKANAFEFPSAAGVFFYVGLVPLLLYPLGALVLWFGAAPITKFIIPPIGRESESSSFTLLQAQSVAFAAVGMLLLLTSIPEISEALYKVYQLNALDSRTRASFSVQAHVLGASIRLLLGVLLLFGSKGLSGLLIRFREAGLK